jgi:hypothetical protein
LPTLSNGEYEVIAATDLNGDGKPDVLAVVMTQTDTGNTQQLQALLNDGKGGFTQAAPGAVIAQGSGIDLSSCVPVDLKGNGKPSLACIQQFETDSTQGYSLALYPSDGGGTFGSPTTYIIESTLNFNPWTLLIGDFNGDGKQDVAAWQQVPTNNGAATISVQTFLSDGQGGLQTAKDTQIQGPMPNGLTFSFGNILAGDVNSDGKTDLVLNFGGEDSAGQVKQNVILTLLGAGDGTFITPGVSTTLTAATGAGWIGNLTLLDYTGSGHSGLVYVSDGGLQAVPGNGDGSFGTPTAAISLPSNLYIWDVLTARMTNSGRQDLILVADDSVGILLNKGSGEGLGTPVFYPISSPNFIAAADWDGDGMSDVLTIGYEVMYLLKGQGDGTVRDAIGLFPPPNAAEPSITSMTPIDINGNGRTDFVFSQLTYTYANNESTDVTTFSAYLDDGKGGYTLTPNILKIPSNSAYSYVDVVGTADFNRDGKPDLLLEVYSNLTDGSGINGADELVGIALNNGDGTFTFPQTNPATGITNLVSGTTYDHNPIVDINGDGKPDVLLSTGSGIAIYLADGTGKLLTPATTLTLSVAHPLDPVRIAVGDINGDGKPDLAVSFDQTVEWFPGAGDGTFGQPNTISADTSMFSPIALGDWNGDGALDLATGQEGYSDAAGEWVSPYIEILTNDGKGNFTEVGEISDLSLDGFSFLSTDGTLPHDGDIYVADLNGDGHPDLVITGEKQDIFVALGKGDGTFAPSQEINAGASPDLIMFATVQGVPNSIVTFDAEEGEYLTLLLNQAHLTTSLTASAASITTGDSVTLTAAILPVVSGSPVPVGTVNFLEGSTTVGSVELTGGTASHSLSGLTAGSHTYTAQYSGDSNYQPVTLSGVTVTVTQLAVTPAVTVALSPSTITTTQSLTVKVTVAASGGNATPTGLVTLASGSYSAQLALSSGVANFTVAAGTLPSGSDTLTATYSPDGSSSGAYTGATQSATVTVGTPIGTSTPSITVTPSAAIITNQQAVIVAVSVAGANGEVVPTGTVTLASGAYSAQQSLTNGAANFTIAAGTLLAGANTLTATYSGDGTFAAINSTVTVTVSEVMVTAPAPSPVSAGASATATAIVSTGSTYSGTMNLTCTLTGSPSGAQSVPTCSLNPASVTIASGSNGTSVLTVNTTAASATSSVAPFGQNLWHLGGGCAALAALLMFGIPARRRRWASMIVLVFLVFAGAIGCGAGSSTTPPISPSTPATTPGKYTFTLTGTDSADSKITTSTNVIITVQ